MNRSVSRERVVWGTPSFWMNVFPLYFGRYRGFFAEKGIDLEIKYFHGGPELAGVVHEGKIQIGTMGVPPLMRKNLFGRALARNLANWETETKIDHAGFENAVQIQKQMGAIRMDLRNEDMVMVRQM